MCAPTRTHVQGAIQTPQEVRFAHTQLRRLRHEYHHMSRRLESVEDAASQLLAQQQQVMEFPAAVAARFKTLDDRLYSLNRSFLTEAEQRVDTAATTIAAVARGWIIRRRYHDMRAALFAWRQGESAGMISALGGWMRERVTVHRRTDEIARRVVALNGKRMFLEWLAYTRAQEPARHALAERVQSFAIVRLIRSSRKMLLAWHGVASGPHSRKVVEAAYKQRWNNAEMAVIRRVQSSGWQVRR